MRKLQSLPKLPVVRDTYCSQEMTDEICNILEKDYSNHLTQLYEEEKGVRISTYYTALDKFLFYPITEEISKVINIPSNDLGMIDLIFEISRRLRVAYSLPEILPQGSSIATSPEGPFPKLPEMQVDPYTLKEGLTQEIVDKILHISYSKQPFLWFLLGETIRTNIRINTIDTKIMNHFKQLWQPDENISFIGNKLGKLRNEAIQRTKLLCGLTDADIKKLCEPQNITFKGVA